MLSVLLLACRPADTVPVPATDDPATTSPDTPTDGGDTTTTTVDCPVDDDAFAGLTVATTQISTVVRVTWTSDAPGAGRVVVETDGEAPIATPFDADTADHEVLVRGLLPDRDYTLVAEEDGACSSQHTFRTGALYGRTPELDLVTYDADQTSTAWFPVTIQTPDLDMPVVLDGEGRVVWVDGSLPGILFRTVVARDGQSLLVNGQAYSADDPGPIYRIGWDGTLLETIDVPAMHTDFVELPEGGFAALGWEIRQFGDRKLLGDTIVEVDPDGTSRAIWSTFDVVPVDLTREYPRDFYFADPTVEDWTHANGISYDEDLGVYHVTINLVEAVARVKRGTGETEWVLSDQMGDFTNTGSEPLVMQPHSVVWLGDGRMLVFNRSDARNQCSEAVELAVDEANHTAERAWSYATEDCLRVHFLGQAGRADNGNTTVIFSDQGRIDTVTPEGELVRSVDIPGDDDTFGFGGRVESLY